MDWFNSKRIADPVYGTIGLSELESRVINTGAFLRLRNVKQLGLAHYVFPGADFSRFAHSLGCCHVAGRILDAIKRTDPCADLSEDDIQLYRLAGLLHDIGHYPFSHAVEEAIKEFYTSDIVDWPSEQKTKKGDDAKIFKHERTGREILDHDGELTDLLSKNGYSPESIWSIFMRKGPQIRFANLISSDLDADRMDYLLRNAHHTGLPYGTVDLDYIISQMRLDSDENVCISVKALRAADHLLLCRYFDYRQVYFHKTVAAFELVLKDVIASLLQESLIACSRDDVTRMIKDGKWYEFDDISLIERMRQYASVTADETGKVKARSILERNPPRLVYVAERLARRDETEKKRHQQLRRQLEDKKKNWAEEFGIDVSRWYVWRRTIELTEVGSYTPLGQEGREKSEHAARVRTREDSLESEPITSLQRSLMNVMSKYANYMLRVYVLLAPEELEKRPLIEERIQRDLSG